jgi:hypothetical protein
MSRTALASSLLVIAVSSCDAYLTFEFEVEARIGLDKPNARVLADGVDVPRELDENGIPVVRIRESFENYSEGLQWNGVEVVVIDDAGRTVYELTHKPWFCGNVLGSGAWQREVHALNPPPRPWLVVIRCGQGVYASATYGEPF